MESWEDELLLDDDFSDEEEDAEEQIEETGLEMDADGFADWEDSSDTAPVDETLEEALAEEHTLELESELEQDEHPRDYNAELEDEEEEAAPTSEKRLKREIRAEALKRLEEAARTESDFLTVVDEWNKLDRNRERRERDHENLRGDVPLEFQAVPEPKIAPLWMNLPRFRQLCQGNFLDIIFSCPYELHELTANRFLSKLFFTLSDEQKELGEKTVCCQLMQQTVFSPSSFLPSVMSRRRCCITCSSSNTAPHGLPPSVGSPTGTSESYG